MSKLKTSIFASIVSVVIAGSIFLISLAVSAVKESNARSEFLAKQQLEILNRKLETRYGKSISQISHTSDTVEIVFSDGVALKIKSDMNQIRILFDIIP